MKSYLFTGDDADKQLKNRFSDAQLWSKTEGGDECASEIQIFSNLNLTDICYKMLMKKGSSNPLYMLLDNSASSGPSAPSQATSQSGGKIVFVRSANCPFKNQRSVQRQVKSLLDDVLIGKHKTAYYDTYMFYTHTDADHKAIERKINAAARARGAKNQPIYPQLLCLREDDEHHFDLSPIWHAEIQDNVMEGLVRDQVMDIIEQCLRPRIQFAMSKKQKEELLPELLLRSKIFNDAIGDFD
eukprot:CAMPEP_0197023692 /NCGR_PEP_ID=MMETSP1384-20130603/4358_1 /TAXON_ID=29189 /ORGANISM="Ammonia sp." /LENGTH=241 /DNA_ID=CAMNT_0042451945 /DNA_START=93 /DNA_END=818 /DNA_ORIENTATION=-